jgi:hypothetical protein
MACRIFGCSRTKLFPDKRIKKRNPTVPELTKPCPKAESVGAWFEQLKLSADIMPDEGWYQINDPLRKMVYQNYTEDCGELPHLYTKCFRPRDAPLRCLFF